MAAAANPDIAQLLQEHEKNKKSTQIPLFLGTDKDTSSGRDIIERIDLAAGIANWNDARKIAELRGCVRDRAKKRLDSILRTCPQDMTVWTNVKKQFLAQYDPKGTARSTCAGLAELQQKPGEKVGDFYGRVDEHFLRIMETRQPRHLGPVDGENVPADQLDNMKAIIARSTKDMLETVEQMVFTAGLNETLRQKVMEAGKDSLYEAFECAYEMEIYLADKKAKANAMKLDSIHEDNEDSTDVLEDECETEEEFNVVNAMRMRRGLPPRPRPKFFRRSGYSSQSQVSSGSGNGNGKKTEVCRYCKKMGHRQVECRKRIREGGLCIDQNGKPWNVQPKANVMNSNQNSNQPAGTLNSFRSL